MKQKQLIFSIFILATFACQKQVDCDNYRSKCTYYLTSFSDCTPNGSELGWQWDGVDTTIVFDEVWGCPEQLENEFNLQMDEISKSSEDYGHFFKEFPSTCKCE